MNAREAVVRRAGSSMIVKFIKFCADGPDKPSSTKAYASKGLLTRHCGPDSGHVVECRQWYVFPKLREGVPTIPFSRARVKKHSFSRHMKSCVKRLQS
jgi:hypothetical protein